MRHDTARAQSIIVNARCSKLQVNWQELEMFFFVKFRLVFNKSFSFYLLFLLTTTKRWLIVVALLSWQDSYLNSSSDISPSEAAPASATAARHFYCFLHQNLSNPTTTFQQSPPSCSPSTIAFSAGWQEQPSVRTVTPTKESHWNGTLE